MAQNTSLPDLEDLKIEIRSLLIPHKHGCTERDLQLDYAKNNGKNRIPYSQMGYASLLELLQTMPDVVRIDMRTSPPILRAVSDHATQHIHDMVQGQKTTKKPRVMMNNIYRTVPGPSQYSTPTYRVPTYPSAQTYNQPTNSIPVQRYQTNPSPSRGLLMNHSLNNALSQNQNLSDLTRASAHKSIASFPPRGLISSGRQSPRTIPNYGGNSLIQDENVDAESVRVKDDECLRKHGPSRLFLRRRMRQFFLKYANGCWLRSIPKLYQKSFDEEFKLELFGLKDFSEFFNSISDFVDPVQVKTDEEDRLLKLKASFIEAVKQEPPMDMSLHDFLSNQPLQPDQQSPTHSEAPLHQTMANGDQSEFVALNFRYKRIEYQSNATFEGVLGDIVDPSDLSIVNYEFINARDDMMVQMENHYNQIGNQSFYNIPWDELEENMACVYYHIDRRYYRAFIEYLNPTNDPAHQVLGVRLVDFGASIENIEYHSDSTILKFLHQDFASLPTGAYDCRLADIAPPGASNEWSSEARIYISDLLTDRQFLVQITGQWDSIYCVQLWLDDQHQVSINRLLVERRLAVESHDNQYINYKSLTDADAPAPKSQSSEPHYVEETLLADPTPDHDHYRMEENSLKHFIISIEHAYYFVKHPFTQRACLPCFELARLLAIDDQEDLNLNILRGTPVELEQWNQPLFDQLLRLPESRQCPHLHRDDGRLNFKLYDLRSVRTYLFEIGWADGDVLDAFEQEDQNSSKAEYWHENQNRYISGSQIDSSRDYLSSRRNLLHHRKEQLLSSSSGDPSDLSHIDEMRHIDGQLQHIDQGLHTIDGILQPNFAPASSPSSIRPNPSLQKKSSRAKLRETLLRLARPFDQNFGLNVCFQHQPMDLSVITNDHEDLEERFQDLYRIADNVLKFFSWERDLLHLDDQRFFDHLASVLPDLINADTWQRRIETYNYCLSVVEFCQPFIRTYIERTDLIDAI